MPLGSVPNPVDFDDRRRTGAIGVASGAPSAQTAWLLSGLYLATAVGQPVVGRLVDMYGPRRLYLVVPTSSGTAPR